MKSLSLLLILCSFSLFAQNTTTSSDYDQVTLDGKTAYINVKTGVITTERPKGMVSSSYAATPVSTNTAAPIDATASKHMVVAGETLYSISKKYGVTIAQLKALNPNIDINALSINQQLTVNKTASSTSTSSTTTNTGATYVVEKGDTLYSISRKYNLSVSDVKKMNNLTTNVLSIGQKLVVN